MESVEAILWSGYRAPKAPLVLGHEVAGEVVETGLGVSRFRVGDRVVATHHVPCNEVSLLSYRQAHELSHDKEIGV